MIEQSTEYNQQHPLVYYRGRLYRVYLANDDEVQLMDPDGKSILVHPAPIPKSQLTKVYP